MLSTTSLKHSKKLKRANMAKRYALATSPSLSPIKMQEIFVSFFLKQRINSSLSASTDLELSDEEIIEIYKRRWDIEQGHKDLRQHLGFQGNFASQPLFASFGKEENRIYEVLVARITLSFFPITSSAISIESIMNLKHLVDCLSI